MDSLKINILEDHKSHYLERLLNRNPLLRFMPNSSRIDVIEIFTDISRGSISKQERVSQLTTAVSPERLLESLLKGESTLVTGISHKIIPKLYKIGIKAKELSRMTGQHALFIGYPIIEIIQPSEKKQGPIYAPLFLIPIKEDGLGAKNDNLLIEPLTNYSDRAEIRPNIILKQWIASKYDKNIQFNIEAACEILQNGNQAIKQDFEDSLKACFSDWRNVDNRQVDIDGIMPTIRTKISEFQTDLFVGARLVNSAILGVADFKGQSLVADIDQTIKLIGNADSTLGVMDSFLVPIKEAETQTIDEPIERDKFLVCDSDLSQEKVIWKVRDSDLTVIQGPPGTGKSQTIVNMISDALAKKQRVAVFSQKRAALDVIHKRAKRDGFGELCLLLEDAHKQRISIIESIKNTKNPQETNHTNHIKRDEVAFGLKNSEQIIDSLTLPYIKQENLPFRYADILSRQQVFKPKDYSSSSAWESLINQVGKCKLELPDKKINIQALVNELLNSGYAQSMWRHYGIDKFSLYDREVAEQILRDILSLYDRGLFIPKNIAKRSKWIMVSEYFEPHTHSFGLPDIGISHHKITEAASYFSKNFESYSFQYEDIVSGEIKSNTFKLLLDNIGKSYDVIGLKKKIFENPIYQVMHNGYLEQLYDWDKIIEAAYLEYYRRSLKNTFPDAYKTVTNIKIQKSILRDQLAKKQNMDREWLRLSFKEKEQAASNLNNRDSLRLRGNSKTKTRKTEIRDLFNLRNFEDLTRIFPVVLCNPETASAILPLTTGLFDLVIIDEASQMFVAEAMPLLFRGKRVVIAGDSMQMPPSDFFSSVSDDEEWLDDGSIDEDDADELSKPTTGIPAHGEYCLLDVAERTVCSNDGRRLLEIHYRSASSELIEFSNHAFYEGRLQCPPGNPGTNNLLKTPIVFKQLSAQFNKGVNEIEARSIVEHLREIWSAPNPPTCGVIVFNVTQQACIERLLEELSLNDAEFMKMFERERSREEEGEDVGFFVRSVEHVQGDERDLIIIGSTYSGNSNRFGPLSKTNKGRRRLNVAITRAKKAMLVLSSLNPRSIASSSIDGIQDAEYIFLFLAYARAVSDSDKEAIENILKQINHKRHTSEQLKYDSSFKQEVANFLMSNRYEIESQVGEGGFRIDLAVKNPIGMGYLCGIECDGAIYHSGWKARFNDIWRQNILESKGWKILRIWSTDWYNDKQNTQSEILKQLAQIGSTQNQISI